MHPAIRTQVDAGLNQLEMSEATAIHFDPKDDMTRQEYKDDADINTLLARYGVSVPMRQVVYGENDFTLDLQAAYMAIDQAKDMHAKLPANLREKYPTWSSLLNAMDRGELQFDLSREEERTAASEQEAAERATPKPPTGKAKTKAESRRDAAEQRSKGGSDDSDA